MTVLDSLRITCFSVAGYFVLLNAHFAFGQPVLNSVFPVGGQAGTTVDVTVGANDAGSIKSLQCNIPGIHCEKLEPSRYRLTVPAETLPGLYDLWIAGNDGVSAIRTFVIGRRAEQLEVEPNGSLSETTLVQTDIVVNGTIEKAGDSDHFQFDATKGQRVILECWAERIDSRLRAVLEVYDASGKRLAVNRGYYGVDPLIDFQVPADGVYIAKVQDLVLAGSAEYFYRLDIDTGPRVAFTIPSVVERGKVSQVAIYGWNLAGRDRTESSPQNATGTGVDISSGNAPEHLNPGDFDRVDVEIPAALAEASWPLPVHLMPSQSVLGDAVFPFDLAGSHMPVLIGLTDVPVIVDVANNHSQNSAQEIEVPCEVSGQLVAGDECDWFALEGKRGEVFYIEALGQRINSPVDLEISVLHASNRQPNSPDASLDAGKAEVANSVHEVDLARFNDDVRNIGGEFPTNHLDPSGRWVCPENGRYLIAIRNLTSGIQPDLRRIYRLSVRREDPDFRLVVVPHRGRPAGLSLKRGGREILDILAIRQRGLDGPIRVSAENLPAGIECPDVWLGPGIDRTSVVVSADRNAIETFSELSLVGESEDATLGLRRSVRGGTVVRSGAPNGRARIISQVPLAIAGDAPLRITADAQEPLEHHLYGTLNVKHSPGGILDVAVQIERRDPEHQAAVKLIGCGLPELIANQATLIPAGQQKGYLSFFLPPTLPIGNYSIVVQAETTVMSKEKKAETAVVYSNPVTFNVQPAAFFVEVDPFAVTRARRGETINLGYSSQRVNGFIGKMHTEIAAPGVVTDVVGLRGRGETFVGQSDRGSLQIVVNDDAPLGHQPFLRLFTVGVLEDQPVYFGGQFVSLEIVE